MKVKDVMHKGVDWVSPNTPVTELAKLMRKHDIGCTAVKRLMHQLLFDGGPGPENCAADYQRAPSGCQDLAEDNHRGLLFLLS
jgi:CBS domain-containing protein